ncbi:hypothetical protein BGX28_003106 [Mortierella sp. GBA30]|nr:hypothetical protein BGX28_003106 [Mortierella sp. GBA30]
MQVEGPGRLERINSSRATATSPMSNRQNGTTSNETNNKAFNANSTRNHDREDHASVATGGGNSSCEDRVKDSPPVTDSRRRAQKAGVVRRRSRQRQSLELEDRCGRNSPVGEKHVSESPFSSHGQGYENSASAITARWGCDDDLSVVFIVSSDISRWTRRLSQPDPYPNHRGVHSSQNAIRSSGLRSFSIVSSRPFAPAAIDQPWSEDTPSVIADEDPSAMNESYDSEQDLSQAVDTTQNSADEGTMDDSYGDYDSSSIYDHNYDYNHNLRNWDEDDQLNSDEAYPYGYQVPGDEAREDVDVNDGEDEDLDSDQHLDEIIGTEQQERSHDGGLSHDLVDLSDEEAEEAHILGFGHQQTESSALTDFDHEPTSYSRPILPSSPGPSPRVEAMLETVETEMSAADEALARRLQEEEYAALIGERVGLISPLPS